jgi:hypothetical protein
MELDWDKYITIADKFQHKARYQDREDLRQDIIVRLAEVARNNGHKPFTEGGMVRVASYVVMEYWHDLKRKPKVLSLNSVIEDGDGNTTELIDTIADDNALDLDAWVDAKAWLCGCPERLIEIAYKRAIRKPLEGKERAYLSHYQTRELRKRQRILL